MHISTLPSLQALIREREAMARGTLMARRGRGRNECQFWFVTAFSQSALTRLLYGVWRRREGGILGTTGRKLRWYPGAWALVLQGK